MPRGLPGESSRPSGLNLENQNLRVEIGTPPSPGGFCTQYLNLPYGKRLGDTEFPIWLGGTAFASNMGNLLWKPIFNCREPALPEGPRLCSGAYFEVLCDACPTNI